MIIDIGILKQMIGKCMKIDVEEVRQLQKRIDQINRAKITDINFYENGVKLEIPENVYHEWSYIGLNNMDFINLNFYKRKYNDI